MKAWLTLLTCLVLGQFPAKGIDNTEMQGGTTDSLKQGDSRDSSYIRQWSQPWTFRLYSVQKLTKLVLKTPNTQPATIYEPRAKIGLGVGIFYRSIGSWLGVRVDFFEKNKKTVAYDLQFNQFLKRLANDIYMQYYEGVYLNQDYNNHNIPVEAEFRGDIRTFSTGITSNYYFNWRKFSTGAPYVQSERQLKNAGSFILGGSLNVLDFKADSTIIPNASAFQPDEAITSGSFYTAAANIGYSYTFVFGTNGFVNFTGIAGPGLTRWEYGVDAISRSGVRPTFRAGGRVAAGYNWEHFFTGTSAVVDQFFVFYDGNTLNHFFGNVRLFVGYRPAFNSGRSNR
jgi:hypothetical protein